MTEHDDNRRVVLLSFNPGIRDPMWCGGRTGGYGFSFTAFDGDRYSGGGGGHLAFDLDEIVPAASEMIRKDFRTRDKDAILVDAKRSMHWDYLSEIVDGLTENLPEYDIAAVSVLNIPGY